MPHKADTTVICKCGLMTSYSTICLWPYDNVAVVLYAKCGLMTMWPWYYMPNLAYSITATLSTNTHIQIYICIPSLEQADLPHHSPQKAA